MNSQALDLSINLHDKFIAQDGNPSQNSAVTQEIIDNLGAELMPIPPRISDLNPIENSYRLAGRALVKDNKKKNIIKETFEEFSARVRDIMVNFDRRTSIKLTANMEKRLKAVIEVKGKMTNHCFFLLNVFFWSVPCCFFVILIFFSCCDYPFHRFLGRILK